MHSLRAARKLAAKCESVNSSACKIQRVVRQFFSRRLLRHAIVAAHSRQQKNGKIAHADVEARVECESQAGIHSTTPPGAPPPATPNARFRRAVVAVMAHNRRLSSAASELRPLATQTALALSREVWTGKLAAAREPNAKICKQLVKACLDCDLPQIAIALEQKCSPNCRSDSGRLVLGMSAERLHASAVTLLLENGAGVNDEDKKTGWTALHHVSKTPYRGSLANNTAKILLGAKAKPDKASSDKLRCSPMHVAAAHNNSLVFEILLLAPHGLEYANRFDAEGNACVHIAAKHRSRETIEMMLLAGCDIKLLNERGLTASDVAEEMVSRFVFFFAVLNKAVLRETA